MLTESEIDIEIEELAVIGHWENIPTILRPDAEELLKKLLARDREGREAEIITKELKKNMLAFNTRFKDVVDIYKIAAGCLKTIIVAHGPITKQYIPSAAKRIECQIKARINEVNR